MQVTPVMLAAAWGAWHARHGGKLGPGVAFREAIEAALAAMPDTPTPPLSPDSTGPAGEDDDRDDVIALLRDTNAWQAKRINELLATLPAPAGDVPGAAKTKEQ
jgi:hypothetical protein